MTDEGWRKSLKGRYDDDRRITVAPCINHEVSIRIGNQDPLFLDGLDFLRIVAEVVLNDLYEPSPTANE